MKITVNQLRRIIKEEVRRSLNESTWDSVFKKVADLGFGSLEEFKTELSQFLTTKNKFDAYAINAFLENQGASESDETFKLAEEIASLYG